MKIDLVASYPHYRDHLLPIFKCLPAELQGDARPGAKPGRGNIALVAGWADVAPLRGSHRMIYVEHGAGQSYVDASYQPGYSASGGRRHQGVIGFVAPSQHVADNWKTAPSVAVGCPKMDAYMGLTPIGPPSVCFAFHWDCLIAPETRSAFSHYQPRLTEVVDRFRAQGVGVYGHAHPRWEGRLDKWLATAGMTPAPDDRTVFQTASVLFVDNSSLAFEFASLGRPVVSLNAPWYRRDIEHGLRFWSHIPGIDIDDPEQLLTMNVWDLIHDDPGRTKRDLAVAHTYAYMDGSSARRAAEWVTNRLTGM